MTQLADRPKWKKKQQGNNSSAEKRPVGYRYSLNTHAGEGELGVKTNLKKQLGGKNSLNTSLIKKAFHDTIPGLFVSEYFSLAPSYRADLLKGTAELIRSDKAVSEILDWSSKREIRDGYDAGISLLAECKNIDESMLQVADKLLGDYPNYDRDETFVVDEKLEVLIKGIACSEHITPDRKLEMISSFIPGNDRRSVKAAIIDSLLMIEDEADADEIRSRLDHFMSDSEPDEYIREYAQDAAE
jgi:hypothetical protein